MHTLPFLLSGFEIQQISSDETILKITAFATSPTAVCPSCQQISYRVHSYYTRSPQDLPISGCIAQLALQVRRFRCQNQQCQRQTFAERLSALPVSARQTARLGTILDAIAVVLSGQAGSRLTDQLAMPVSADTLLRRAKKAATPSRPTPRVLGVDDFAFRRGRTYGTLLLDLESHQPVDLLEDRRAETLAEWLRHHPGVEIISRDRSTEYLRGATEGAPQAQQIIDRWHVLKNLREAVERFLNRIHSQLKALADNPEKPVLRQKRTSTEKMLADGSRLRRHALYEQVVEHYKQGGSILGTAKQFKISRQTVRKFVQAPTFPERARATRTTSALDPYRTYLQQRWQQGCHTVSQLWQEAQTREFSGSRMMIYRWVQLQEEAASAATSQSSTQAKPSPNLPAPRHLAWLLIRDLERLDEEERQTLTFIRHDPSITLAYELVQQFVTMMKERSAQQLDTWLLTCLTSGISELENFAQGLQKETSALQAALTLPYSNGPVEGKINKLKYIKRSMYGRGGFSLLRQRVLKAT
ncbi:transposase [Dictyobacter vulcani]|uniref:Transposase n=1 Tax=Dictyobacter vulcani TaxID=2607529 RepID=A0A5J4KN89_9CHLR|nr:ISL3 family transposase [Dictyobacter vulcani]GER87880.1 transposase [Dictyobacter vulcani]GER89051.1 transposase [Dictyobacter vulcani]